MSDLAEDRIHDETTDAIAAYVAARTGIARVAIAGDRVGRFGLDRRCDARDVAADGDCLAVATGEDVLLREPTGGEATGESEDGTTGESDGTGDPYRGTGHGPAVAVAVDDGTPVAADAEGRIARRLDGEWLEIADVDAPVRSLDGGLVAAGDGVYLAGPDGLDDVGLDDVRDVAAAGPYAATGEGLYVLGNGWIREREGGIDVVAATRDGDGATGRGGSGRGGERAHAAAGADLFERRDGEWAALGVSATDPIAGVAHGPGTYAVTETGTVFARDDAATEGDREWRSRSVGVSEVRGIAVPGPRE